MKTALTASWVLLLCGLLLTSCSRKETELLRITSALPAGTIENNSVLLFVFSRGVAPADSINQWTTTPYVEFSPAVPGTFTWRDTSTLVFSPDAPFAGDTKFKGKINTSLLKRLSGASAFEGSDEFGFSTASFTLKSAEFFYDRIGQTRQLGIKANLEFTYGVNPTDVAKHITVTVDKERRQPTQVSATNSNVIPIEIGIETQTEKEREITITFDDQLISTETTTRIKMEQPFVYRLPPVGELAIYGHEFSYDGTTSWIRIRTSQEVDAATATSFISLAR